MDFGLNDEQELLQRTAREFFEKECPPTLIRALIKDPDGYPHDLYRKMAELGFTGLIVPEAFGGAGLSMLDLAIVMEEAGRSALPGPFLSSSVLAVIAFLHAGSAAQKKMWLPRLVSLETIAT